MNIRVCSLAMFSRRLCLKDEKFLWVMKKGEMDFGLVVYGRFLIVNSASMAPTTMIAITMPATEGKKYESIVVTGMLVGSVVAAGAGSIDIAVSAYDGQYELEPAKVAMIVYFPGMSGGTHL